MPDQSETTVDSLSDALMVAKYMGLDRARFVLSALLQSGEVSLDAFRDALAKRAAYVERKSAHAKRRDIKD